MLINNRKITSILILFVVSLFLVMTSCALSSAPAPLPSSPVPPASILAELNLVAEPLVEKELNVEKVYSGSDEPGNSIWQLC